MNVPISGKDFKSGQTLMKTVLAPMFKTRMLGVSGWFSTNILGNRDGEVLDQPENFKTKEVSKLSVIDNIFEPEKYPDLYGDVYHKVRINYYPPRKDNKEAWDNIDISAGWAIRWKSRLTSCAVTPFLLLPSRSTWLFSVIWHCVQVCAASRRGCPSSARARCTISSMSRYTICSSNGAW